MFNKLFGWFYLNKHPEGVVPGKVITGALLLYFALLLQMISNLLDGINLAAFIFVFGFLIYLVFMTGEGRKWARWVMLALILFNLIAFSAAAVNWNDIFKTAKQTTALHSPVLLFGLFCAEVLVEVIALILLFSKDAKAWFGRERINNAGIN
ncbi:hypothetical protein [Mucilaginibacter sp. FT3.2]|uniref:hypothetical protein n=1 Tax=Mucilaginibacter sp. FT3.2 TaxID=2723090 RepID=UPI00161CA04A|nr:hypothetical protein [Mucilaginibacter sp. FT3.2]MBB6234653.1 glucan phosphoethanolaminetransferase (alkaline phosphatase superfamily) [Mucilaginibacter sp. FT3.2]